VLYGSHMNCMGPAYHIGDRWHHLGDAWDVWGPCESCVHHMGAILEVDGSHMVPSVSFTVPSDSHMVHEAQIWCTQLHMAPILHMHHQYGTICLPCVAIWLPYCSHKMHMAPMQCAWHPYSGHCNQMVNVAPFASHGSLMGEAIWKLCTPYEPCRRCGVQDGSCVCHTGAVHCYLGGVMHCLEASTRF
jgi:hypothetical protein